MTEALDLILDGVEGLLGVETAGVSLQGSGHGGAVARHSRRADLIRVEIALWYEEVRRHHERLRRVRNDIAVGKLSGAMGTFAHQGPEIEEYVCEKLGLKADPVSNQVVQRDRHASYATALALTCGQYRKDCHRDSPSPAYGSARSRRVFLRRPKGVIGDAA